jgi:CHASE3 domain sensor protein
MKRFLSENWIIVVIGFFLMASMAMAIRNNAIIRKNHERQQQAELIRQQTEAILSKTMHGLDLGVRGYALNSEVAMLRPYEEAIQTNPVTFFKLDSLLERQAYAGRKDLQAVKLEVDNYVRFSKLMVEVATSGDMEEFKRMIREDKGYDVWKKFSAFASPLFAYEAQVNKEAQTSYKAAMRVNLIMQLSILVLAIPLLYVFVMKLRKERDGRTALLKKVEENDRQFVFNSGTTVATSADQINESSIQNVTTASKFVSKLAEGDYNVGWEGLNGANLELNRATLAGNLLQLRDKLKQVKEEDEKRNWINEGLTAFSELTRQHQNEIKVLCEQCVKYLAKYLSAQQAGIFLLKEENGEVFLSLEACYAFDRKKFSEKRIELGEGLIGQTYLEGEPVRLKELPNGYTHITSGLGEAMPKYMVIIPFKTDSKIPAIIEMFSFSELEDHHLRFLQRAGEVLASAIITTQTALKMKQLIESSANDGRERVPVWSS